MKRKWVQIRSAGEEMLMEGVNHARDLKATSIIPAAVAVVLVGVLVAAYPSLPPSLQVASRIVLQIRYAASGTDLSSAAARLLFQRREKRFRRSCLLFLRWGANIPS